MWRPATDVHPQPTVILKRFFFFSIGNARARMKCFLRISVSCNHHLELLENVVFHSLLQFLRHSLLVVATANCKRQASGANKPPDSPSSLFLFFSLHRPTKTQHTHTFIYKYICSVYICTHAPQLLADLTEESK